MLLSVEVCVLCLRPDRCRDRHVFALRVQEDGHWARIPAFGKSYDALADALECEVDRRISDGEAIDCQLIEADRKPRPVYMNPFAASVHAQAKTCLQHHENRSCRPGLRQAGRSEEHTSALPSR